MHTLELKKFIPLCFILAEVTPKLLFCYDMIYLYMPRN